MNLLKRKAFQYIEKAAAKKATVLDVRAWQPATVFEVDLHLPDIAMENWQSVQHMKVKVAEMTYRDYTPALWDCETRTCTLIIDAGHEGLGAQWIRNLKPGDTLTHLGIAPTTHRPVASGNIFCVGDASAMGHFLALEQLAKNGNRFQGLITFEQQEHEQAFHSYFRTLLHAVTLKHKTDLLQLITQQPLTNETVFIAGGIPLMSELRRVIKRLDYFKGNVKMHGFWS